MEKPPFMLFKAGIRLHRSALKNKCDTITPSVKMLNIKISLLWPSRKTPGQSFPACFCVAVTITADYSQITSTCGQWKLFTISPTVQHEVTLLGQKPAEEKRSAREGSEEKRAFEQWGVRVFSKELFFFIFFLKHRVFLEFIFQILLNWKQMLRFRPHENIKHSCCFPNHHQKRAGSEEEVKEWVSKENYQVRLQHHSEQKNALRQTLQDVFLF